MTQPPNPSPQPGYPAGGYPAGAQPIAQPEKKPWYKKPGCLIGIAILIVIFAIIGGCMAMVGGVANEVDKAGKEEHQVVYKVEGDAQDALVTFTSGSSDTAQENGIAAGWTKEITLKGFSSASLTATNGMYDEGAITCKIEYNGETIAENTARGAGASASCSVLSSDFPDK